MKGGNEMTREEQIRQTIIEKACKWLLEGGYFVNNTETIDDFKQAMEE